MSFDSDPARHQKVLATCGDVPAERPSFAISLPEVGISNKTVWVTLPPGRLPFSLTLDVDLAAERRGIHMSRLEEAITLLHERPFADLREYGVALLRETLRTQEANQGRVELRGLLPWSRPTKVSGRISLDSLEISCRIEGGRDAEAAPLPAPLLEIGVGVHHLTACPCTQAYNRVWFDMAEYPAPLPTHSQRSFTTLRLSAAGDEVAALPAYDELLACLAVALHLTQDLLKRPDEAELVRQAHTQPQFAEDAVRETARAAGQHFGHLAPATRVVIESVSLESIHIHDVRCRLDTSLAAIRAAMTSGP